MKEKKREHRTNTLIQAHHRTCVRESESMGMLSGEQKLRLYTRDFAYETNQTQPTEDGCCHRMPVADTCS